MVLWLIGISGAGKTTLAKMLEVYFKGKGKAVYVIDGDIIRDFYDRDLGYSKSDREANIKRILLAAYVLDQNNIITIVANISPFEYLRKFARKKIPGYNQIYLQKDINISMKNDVKGVYKDNLCHSTLVGVDVPFENPEQNDLVIKVDCLSVRAAYLRIIDFITQKYGI